MAVFGQTQDLTSQDRYDIYLPFLASVDAFTKNLWLTKHLPILQQIALNLPEKYAEKLSPGYLSFRNVSLAIRVCISGLILFVLAMREMGEHGQARHEKGILQTEDGRDTVFDLLLESNDQKNYKVPDMTELVDEAFLFLIAGSDTTAYSMACATYYILTHEDVLSKLKTELSEIPRHDDGRLDCKNLQSLPYLVGMPYSPFPLSH
ncbi:cytochrome P450 [Penicillium longicatenatum]|uniref:cytochrome P450 n=1 Tax=Penicillium longicatenatum TaxID=1561947 RepID=UPI0025493088|nr:cytochrome P450 [Penicillium longicatenatum]KAJ5636384.1 cytochrome P450 [Penicillium longicatenatum]